MSRHDYGNLPNRQVLRQLGAELQDAGSGSISASPGSAGIQRRQWEPRASSPAGVLVATPSQRRSGSGLLASGALRASRPTVHPEVLAAQAGRSFRTRAVPLNARHSETGSLRHLHAALEAFDDDPGPAMASAQAEEASKPLVRWRIEEDAFLCLPSATKFGASADADCAICCEALGIDTAGSVSLPCWADRGCSSFFHRSCIRGWLERNPNCPLCRQSVKHLVQPITPPEEETVGADVLLRAALAQPADRGLQQPINRAYAFLLHHRSRNPDSALAGGNALFTAIEQLATQVRPADGAPILGPGARAPLGSSAVDRNAVDRANAGFVPIPTGVTRALNRASQPVTASPAFLLNLSANAQRRMS
eukprot:TRINITY_DN13540_c0_g1_i3.p1 TRINITY_DN13540_c0_g1~~TRINITY_DN13540_c0_g1_i3.p1  ORF type:complete len:402 (-),score=31.13 TRINITY_DN13540_c0_g1_i3:126-1217(-)